MKNIISNVTMNIDIDSRIAIVGKNGAGKTTLLDVCEACMEAMWGEDLI